MKRYHDLAFIKFDVKAFFKSGIFIILLLFIVQILLSSGLISLFVFDRFSFAVVVKFVSAKLISFINPDYPILFTNHDGTSVVTTAHVICHNESIHRLVGRIKAEAFGFFMLSSWIYALAPIVFFILLRPQSVKKKNVHIRGAKLADKKAFYKLARKRSDKTTLPFGSILMPKSCEEKSTLVIGKPGSGKTTLLSSALQNLDDDGARLVVYDYKGDFTERFYDPENDILFNPFDSRDLVWNIFNEIRSPLDIDAIAASLIPDLKGTTADPFWSDGARDVISSCLFYLHHKHRSHRNSDIWRLVSSDGRTIAKSFGKTPGCEKGYKYVVEHKSKQALSILAVVMQYCSCFQFIQDSDNAFSVNDWVMNGDGNIFITNNAGVQDSLKPILSLFIDLLARKILSMPDYAMRKTVFFLDEFTTLQKLPSLINLLTLGRSKRSSCYLGTQSFGQIENLYGKAHKESIINACANKAIFSMADSATAKYCSELIGEAESIRSEKSFSTGSDYKEGASKSYRNVTEPILLPSEIMDLKDLELVVKFANYPPVKSKLEYIEYPKVHSGFIMRPDLIF